MKKGFTLIELLGIIVILGLIVAFTVPSLINLKKNEEQKEYDNFLKNVSLAAETFYQTNTKMCDFDNYTYCYINVSDLIENDYLRNDLINPKNKNVISYLDTVILEKNEDNTIKYYYSSMYGYVKDNLLVHYDAIRNTNSGHDYLTTTWEDISENKNNATLKNFTSVDTWYNNSLNFSGKNYNSTNSEHVDFNLNDSLDEFTITLYTKQGKLAENDYAPRLFHSQKKDLSSMFRIYPQYKSGVYIMYLEFAIKENEEYVATFIQAYPDNYAIKNDEVYNLTITCSNSDYEIYKNGSLVKSINISGYNEISNLKCSDVLSSKIILGNAENLLRAYKGEIYNFKIYNKVLTDEQIKQNYEVDKLRYNL